jgi:2-oxo-4-hydroxy-4-carboxy-5-ureidoimidazoline decarboxylase
LRGIDCGALELDEVTAVAKLSEAELRQHARRPANDDDDVGLRAFNRLPLSDVRRLLLTVCSSSRWAEGVAAQRPFASAGDLHAVALGVLENMDERDVDDALAGHPRIGERPEGEEGAVSRREQAGVEGADHHMLEALAAGNREYEKRFGHVYLVRASGRSANELLTLLNRRLGNSPEAERMVVREELGQINAIRLDRLLAELGQAG